MSRLYRCYACKDKNGVPGKDFESDAKEADLACPTCRLKHDEAPELIVTLSVIHFEPRHANPALANVRGCGSTACGVVIKLTPGIVASGDPRSSNCPACKSLDTYRTAHEEWSKDPRFDIPLVIKGDGVVLPSEEVVKSMVAGEEK
jgi:DNA-directed RNA polymerase subunit RPC12/RpoP